MLERDKEMAILSLVLCSAARPPALCPQRLKCSVCWRLPCRLGWIPASAVIVALTLGTVYSGLLILRLYHSVPDAVLFGDIGEAAAGPWVPFFSPLQSCHECVLKRPSLTFPKRTLFCTVICSYNAWRWTLGTKSGNLDVLLASSRLDDNLHVP
jgi:hypothetical protein